MTCTEASLNLSDERQGDLNFYYSYHIIQTSHHSGLAKQLQNESWFQFICEHIMNNILYVCVSCLCGFVCKV